MLTLAQVFSLYLVLTYQSAVGMVVGPLHPDVCGREAGAIQERLSRTPELTLTDGTIVQTADFTAACEWHAVRPQLDERR